MQVQSCRGAGAEVVHQRWLRSGAKCRGAGAEVGGGAEQVIVQRYRACELQVQVQVP